MKGFCKYEACIRSLTRSLTSVTKIIQNSCEDLFGCVHDQGVAFVYSHVPIPSRVVLTINNTQLLSPQNITLSNHIGSGWVQTCNNSNQLSSYKLKSNRKRYQRWTENEPRLFLFGLKACGEGHWKGISELYVVSKSPSQVSIEPSKLVLPAPIMLLEEISSKDDVLNCANHIGKCNNSIVTVPRKKCKHWTEDEHKLFVLGHAKYQEKWKEVSKNYVPSKSSTQIASHAQKYFLRQNLPENKRKRKSIHDITVQDIDAEMKSRTKYAQLIIENLIL
ncbi:Transcription factor [Vigna angularis]|uniref:Transcription factor n=1 Tax=Phaseolus angularis TaxID=3914 RepID=A0A8T0JFP2_PHAAN|nr:Transcription factor [Vigna angularis]